MTDAERDVLREEILSYCGKHVSENAEAARASPALRPVLQQRILDDLRDCFHMGEAAKTRRAARHVQELAWLHLKRPMYEAGLGLSLATFLTAAQRLALQRLKAPVVIADLRDAAATSREVGETVDALACGSDSSNYIRTGLTVLDYRLGGGLPLGEMTLCGAPTGAGKTTFAMQVAWDAAQQDRGLVLVVSPEMRARDLWLRLALRAAGFSRDDLKPGSPTQAQAQAAVVSATSTQMERSNLLLLDRVDADLTAAIEAARMLHETRGPLFLLVLDYAQQLASSVATSDAKRYLEVGRVATAAVELAAQTEAAVLVTSQVNSMRVGKGAKAPVEYSFRESQKLEEKAAIAFVMEAKRSERRMRFTIRKNRHGGQGFAECRWSPELFKLSDLSEEESK